MPIMKCSKDGQSGYKWGDGGNCITGKDAKNIVIKMGLAINYKKHGKEGGKKFSEEMKHSKGQDSILRNSERVCP